MLEGIVASILAKYLGDYVEDFQKENVKLSIGLGDAVLENVTLKTSALNTFELPFTFTSGFISKLNLKIPWSNLQSRPVEIRISSIFLTLAPTLPNQGDETVEEEIKIQQKLRKLQLAEYLSKPIENTADTGSDPLSDDSFTKRLSTKIIDNLQVFIDKVHILFQNPQNQTNAEGENLAESDATPYVGGITLEHLHAQSCNENWEPTFLNRQLKLIHKLISLKNLAIYWNPDKGIPSSSPEETRNFLEEMIFKEDFTPPDIHYLLQPVCGSLKLVLNKSEIPDMNLPKYTIDLQFQEFAVALEENQYSQLFVLINRFRKLLQQKYSSHRPKSSPSAKPAAWWNYAIKSVIAEQKERRSRWRWEYISQINKDRLEYIELYTKKKTPDKKIKLTDEEKTQLDLLERRLPYETVLLFRSLAEIFLHKDLAYEASQREEQRKKLDEEEKDSYWVGRFFRSGIRNLVYTTTDQVKLQLTPEIVKELYSALDPNEDTSSVKTDIPKEYVRARVNYQLNMSSMELRDSNKGDMIVKGTCQGLKLSLDIRDTSLSFTGNIKSVEVIDYYTENSVFPWLVAPLSEKLLPDQTPPPTTTVSAPDQDSQHDEDTEELFFHSKREKPPFFSISFEMNPLNLPVDYSLHMSMEPLNIVYSQALVSRIIQFFSRGLNTASLNDLGAVAHYQLDELRKLTQDQLYSIVKNRKIIDLHIDLHAPNILMAESKQENEKPSIVVVGLGTLSIFTNLNKHPTSSSSSNVSHISQPHLFNLPSLNPFIQTTPNKTEVVEEHTEGVSDQDLLYDQYNFSFTSLQLLISDKIPEPGFSSETFPNERQIIDKFDVNFLLDVCKIKNAKLPKFKVSGRLPTLRGHLSPTKCTTLIRVLQFLLKTTDKITPMSQLMETPQTPTAAVENPYNSLSLPETRSETEGKEQSKKGKNASASHASVNKYLFELNFDVPEISLFFRQDPANENPDIVSLHLERLSAQFELRTWSRELRASLRDLSIEDYLQKYGDEFSLLATSSPLHQQNPPQVENALIQLSFAAVPRKSPHYENIDNYLSVTFNQLHFYSNRETIVSLMTFGKIVQQNLVPPPTDSLDNQKPQTASRENGKQNVSQNTSVKLKFEAQLNNLAVTLNKNGQRLAVWTLHQSSALLHVYHSSDSSLKGELGNMQLSYLLEDPLTNEEVEIPILDMLEEGHLVSFSLLTKETPNLIQSFFNLEMSSYRYIYLQEFVTEMVTYFKELEEMESLVSSTATSAISVAKQAVASSLRFEYSFKLQNPLIVIPKNTKLKHQICADLGLITISNTYIMEEGLEVNSHNAEVVALNMKSISDDNHPSIIIENTQLSLSIQTPLSLPSPLPLTKVLLQIPSIGIVLNDQQIYLIFSIFEENLCDRDSFERRCKLSQSMLQKKQVREIQPPPPLHRVESVFLDIQQISFDLFSLNNGKAEGEFSFLADDLHCSIYTFSDGRLDATNYFSSVCFCDKRENTLSKFKELITPRLCGETESQLLSESEHTETESDIYANISAESQIQKENEEDNEKMKGTEKERKKQKGEVEVLVTRNNSGVEVKINWERPYVVVVPEAILAVYRYIYPLQLAGLALSQLWKQTHPSPDDALPQPDSESVTKVFLGVSNPELYLPLDWRDPKSGAFLVRSSFEFEYLCQYMATTFTTCQYSFHADQLQAYKAFSIPLVGKTVKLVEPFGVKVDHVMSPKNWYVVIDIDTVSINVALQDLVLITGISQGWQDEIKKGEELEKLKQRDREKLKQEIHENNKGDPHLESEESLSSCLAIPSADSTSSNSNAPQKLPSNHISAIFYSQQNLVSMLPPLTKHKFEVTPKGLRFTLHDMKEGEEEQTQSGVTEDIQKIDPVMQPYLFVERQLALREQKRKEQRAALLLARSQSPSPNSDGDKDYPGIIVQRRRDRGWRRGGSGIEADKKKREGDADTIVGENKVLIIDKETVNEKDVKTGEEELKEIEEILKGDDAGVTDTLIHFVEDLIKDSSTFTDFPFDEFSYIIQYDVSEKHVKHAVIMQLRVPRLGALYRRLCPSLLSDDLFWKIYFFYISQAGLFSSKPSASHDPSITLKWWKVTGFRECVGYGTTKESYEEVIDIPHWRKLTLPASRQDSSRQLLTLIHKGVPDFRRRAVWLAVTGVTEFKQRNPNFYRKALYRTFTGDRIPRKYVSVPCFGGTFSPQEHHLTQEGVEIAKRVLYVISHEHPELAYCPAIPDLVMLCLHFMNEPETYLVVHQMIEDSHKRSFYFPVGLRASSLSASQFSRLFRRFLPRLYKFAKSYNIRTSQIVEPWFARLFIGILPYQTALRVVDSFMNEGQKVLYRIGLGLLHMNADVLFYTLNATDFLHTLHNLLANSFYPDLLMRSANSYMSVSTSFFEDEVLRIFI